MYSEVLSRVATHRFRVRLALAEGKLILCYYPLPMRSLQPHPHIQNFPYHLKNGRSIPDKKPRGPVLLNIPVSRPGRGE